MSALSRFLRPPPTTTARRAYSSFFSSKSGGGGGRYFNSAKPSKVVVTNANATKVSEAAPEPASDVAAAPPQGTGVINAKDQPPSKTSSSPSSSSSSPVSTPNTTEALHKATSSIFGANSNSAFLHRPQHPVVNAKDFKMHQFFSLHRPLLLLGHPTSILDSAPADAPFLRSAASEAANAAEATSAESQWLLDEFPEATADADAAAARQLTRALTMAHGGAAVAWEDTLRRLGLDVDKDADRVGLQQKWDREWTEVMLDSVKRKRRKKMKKHK
ncbi:hypothetical protein DXG03_005734 [Asterophora parasitica]|uniref:Uncharacterized protein n=1 Tax=Asterophora parasitica TaxID=117018 RepID=A0A9P7KBC9_9AGAR|nr:hypothetical protein DXG03_005734 [Asterophora parasitica]